MTIIGKTQGAPMYCIVEDQVDTNLREKSLMPHMKARDALIKDVRFFINSTWQQMHMFNIISLRLIAYEVDKAAELFHFRWPS